MHVTEWSLREPAARAARVAALELLDRVHATRDRLDDASDLEAHLAWVHERRRSLRGDQRRGADWLLGHLEQRKTVCDAELRQIVDAEFGRATARVEAAMSEYTTSVVETEARFAAVAARLV